MKNFCAPFCAALRRMRAEAGKGQIAFARDLGLSQPVYSRYEKGDREPTLNELIRIAQAIGTTPNDLLGFSKSPAGNFDTPKGVTVAGVIANGSGASINAPVNVTVNAPPKRGRKRGRPKQTKRPPPSGF